MLSEWWYLLLASHSAADQLMSGTGRVRPWAGRSCLTPASTSLMLASLGLQIPAAQA